MKKIKFLLTAFILLLLLCSCTEKTENNIEQVPPAEEEIEIQLPEKEEIPEAVEFSPLAIKDYLLPLEDYSWEREFDAEYVMFHFTSNVVNNRENPYDIEQVRNIFVEGGVSIHYIIDRNGEIHCYIPETRDAWHAGKGTFAEDEKYTNKMNKYAIGIEIMAIGSAQDMSIYLSEAEYNALKDEHIGFTDAQYASLRELVPDICKRNNIPFDKDHVIGHSEYNPAKNDVGELFEWEKLFGQN